MINTGSKREAAYSVTSPELIVYSHGSAIIENQQVFIPFSATYIGMLSSVPDVTVSAIGTPAQIYIQSIEKNGFTVVITPNSINDGATNVRFSWIAVGKRVDADNVAAIPTEIADTNFDSNMNEVMFEEGNKEQSGKPIWWDGQKIRFDAAPEAPKVRKVEPKNR